MITKQMKNLKTAYVAQNLKFKFLIKGSVAFSLKNIDDCLMKLPTYFVARTLCPGLPRIKICLEGTVIILEHTEMGLIRVPESS